MCSLLQGRLRLLAILALLCIVTMSLLPVGCSQGGIVEGEVRYKYVTGMQDRRYYVIVLNEPTDSQPSIVFDKYTSEEIRQCFPASGNLVVDNATEQEIETSYDRIYYLVAIHLTSGSHHYDQAYRTDREIFNEMQLGEKVKVDTEASDIGPKILEIVD